MNRILVLLLLSGLIFATSCSKAPEGEKTEASEKETVKESSGEVVNININPDESMVMWTGSKPTGQHNGIVRDIAGNFQVNENDEIVGGKFILDLRSLEDQDLTPEDGKEKLENHLKSADFFDVANHPQALFQITDLKAQEGEGYNHMVSGNLTIKDTTLNISFPAMIQQENGKIMANTPPFTIDRTKWGIKYRSGAIGTIKDKLIHDEIGLELKIQAG